MKTGVYGMVLKILSMCSDGNSQHTANKKHRKTRRIKDLKFSMAELHTKKVRKDDIWCLK